MSQPKIAVDSQQVRHEFHQCQQCGQHRTGSKSLFNCAGCKMTLYCSTRCQRANWSVHKPICKTHRERHAQVSRLDDQVLPHNAGSDATAPRPSQLVEELRAFLSKFFPAIFQAGFNAVRVADVPMGWSQAIFIVSLDRITTAPSDSRPWSRFRVESAFPVPVAELSDLFGPQSAEELINHKSAQEKRHIEGGNMGTITVMLTAASTAVNPPLRVHNTTCIAFGAHSQATLEISDDWMETFQGTVERLSGRTPAVSSSSR